MATRRGGPMYPRRNWEGEQLFQKLLPIPQYRDDLAKIQRILSYTGKADPLYKVAKEDQSEAAGRLAYQMNYYHDCICANQKYKILKLHELRQFKMRYFFGMTFKEISDRTGVKDQRTLKRRINDDIITRLAVVMYKEGWMPWAGEKPKNEQ